MDIGNDQHTSNSDSNPTLKIIIVGPISVGKTTLVRVLSSSHTSTPVEPTIQPTLHVNICRRERMYDVHMWDTSGQERFDAVQNNYYNNANCIIFVYDNETTSEVVLRYYRKVIDRCNDRLHCRYPECTDKLPKIPVIVLQNKMDLLDSDEREKALLSMYDKRKYPTADNVPSYLKRYLYHHNTKIKRYSPLDNTETVTAVVGNNKLQYDRNQLQGGVTNDVDEANWMNVTSKPHGVKEIAIDEEYGRQNIVFFRHISALKHTGTGDIIDIAIAYAEIFYNSLHPQNERLGANFPLGKSEKRKCTC